MKKLIILTNGQTRQAVEMNFEEVLYKYKNLIRRTIIECVGFEVFNQNEKDFMQEGNISCWKAYETYDQEHCFSTHLKWNLKGRFQQLVKAKKTQKRDGSAFKYVNIDDTTSFDNTKTYQEYIPDDSIDIENEFVNKAFMHYLTSQLKNEELDLLYLNLGLTTVTKLAEKTNTSKANISYKNKRFKTKLANILKNYNEL